MGILKLERQLPSITEISLINAIKRNKVYLFITNAYNPKVYDYKNACAINCQLQNTCNQWNT